MMRWLAFRLRPGMVRVSTKALISLQRNALRAAELEVEGARLRAEGDALEREIRARELVDQHAPAAGVSAVDPRLQSLLEQLPQTAGGALHELAFLALLDTRLWDCRLHAVTEDVAESARHQIIQPSHEERA